MVGDALQNLAQVAFGVQAVELGRAQQGVERRRTLSAAIRAGKQVVLPPNRNRAQRPFGRRVMCALKRCTAFSGENPDRLALVPAGST